MASGSGGGSVEVELPMLARLPWDDVVFPSLLPLLPPGAWLVLGRSCRALHRLIAAFLAQNRVLRLDGAEGSPWVFGILTRRSTNLRQLSVAASTWLTDDMLRPVVEGNRLLERLDLSGCVGLTDTSLQRAAVCLPRLTHLLVADCRWLSGTSLDYFAFHHSNRVAIDCETPFCQMSTVDSLQIIGQSGLRTKARLGKAKKSRYAGPDQLYDNLQSTSYISKICRKRSLAAGLPSPRHRHFRLQQLDLTGCSSLIRDGEVSRLAVAFADLRMLGLGRNPSLTDTSLAAVAKNLSHLVSLDISGCKRMTDKGIFTVSKLCKTLKSVNVTNCSFTRRMGEYLKAKGIRLEGPPPLASGLEGPPPLTPGLEGPPPLAPGLEGPQPLAPGPEGPQPLAAPSVPVMAPAFLVPHTRLISPQMLRKSILEKEEAL